MKANIRLLFESNTKDQPRTITFENDTQPSSTCTMESSSVAESSCQNEMDKDRGTQQLSSPTSQTLPSSLQLDIALIQPPHTDNIKLDAIEKKPFVEPTFNFPATEIPEKRSKTGVSFRKCSFNLLQKHKFLGYSKSEDGVYCIPCFFWNEAPKFGTEAELLISAPLRDWKRLSAKANKHEATHYHQAAVSKMEAFHSIQKGEMQSVRIKMKKCNAELAEKNTQIIRSLFECMRLCISRGFALRGHRDGGMPNIDFEEDLDASQSDDTINLGNYKSIVKFAAQCGDTSLVEHLKSHGKNATYMSNTSQMDMLDCVLRELQLLITEEIKGQNGKLIYALSADEVTDSSVCEQLAIVVRTVSPTGVVRERLLEYVKMRSTTGEAIGKSIMECVNKHGLRIDDCRAQTYDGAGNMSGYLNGARSHIEKAQPLAKYFHCSSHKLNLALNTTSTIPEYRTLMSNVTKLGIFFKYSPKRQGILKEELDRADPPIGVTKVKLLCNTRWVERHTTMFELKKIYSYVLAALEIMKGPGFDSNTVVDANGLSHIMRSAGFIAAFVIAERMLGFTKQLSLQLQGSTEDVHSAHRNIREVQESLQSVRNDSSIFDELWDEMTVMAGAELEVPRLSGRQTLRANHPATSGKDYYYKAYFLPYIDHLNMELSRRFESASVITDGFLLVPTMITGVERNAYVKAIEKFAAAFKDDLPSYSTLHQESSTWYSKWSKDHKGISELSAAYVQATQHGLYPNIGYLLKLLLTIPVTSATSERSNSTLKYIKNNLRSSLSQSSLNAFVLGYKHKDLMTLMKTDELVLRFINSKRRRLLLQNPTSE